MSAPVPATSDASAPPPAGRLARARQLWAAWPGTLLRALIAVAPILWLVRRVHLEEITRSLRLVSARDWLAALALTLGALVVAAWRWRLLLRGYGAQRPPGILALTRHTLVGWYYSLLPSGLAGEVARGYRVQGSLASPGRSYLVVVVDRLLGLLGLLLLAAVALAAAPAAGRSTVSAALELGLLGALGLGLLLLGLPWILGPTATRRGWRARVARLPLLGRVLGWLPPTSAGAVLAALGLSIANQLLTVLAIALLARPLSPLATLLACGRAVPLILLLIYVPLTPAGIGQRELLFATFFGLVGVPAPAAVAMAWLNFSISIAIALLGAGCRLGELALHRGATEKGEQRKVIASRRR